MNWYKAGTQKSLKIFDIKVDSIQSAIRKFWYMSGMEAKKPHKIVPTVFCCDFNDNGDNELMVNCPTSSISSKIAS